MYEKSNLPDVRKSLGCIEVCTDPKRRVSVSALPDKPSPAKRIKEKVEAIEAAANIAASGMYLLSGIGMMYLVIRMSQGIVW